MGCMTTCGPCGPEARQFLTTEEKVEKLKQYKEYLENEAKGVEEAISKIRKAK